MRHSALMREWNCNDISSIVLTYEYNIIGSGN